MYVKKFENFTSFVNEDVVDIFYLLFDNLNIYPVPKKNSAALSLDSYFLSMPNHSVDINTNGFYCIYDYNYCIEVTAIYTKSVGLQLEKDINSIERRIYPMGYRFTHVIYGIECYDNLYKRYYIEINNINYKKP